MTDTKRSPSQADITADFDRFASDYEDQINAAIAFGGSDHQFYIDVKRDWIVELSKQAFGSTEALSVLDLGCGLGAYHEGLKGRFASLHGIDVSAESLTIAAKKHPHVSYTCFDGETMPFRSNSFDAIFCVCVMHHVPVAQWSGLVAEMARILKPGGLAMVFEHNPYNPATQYIVRNCEIDKDAVLLRPSVLRNLFREANFDSIETRAILTVPPKTPLLKRIDRLAGFAMIGAQYYLQARKLASPGE